MDSIHNQISTSANCQHTLSEGMYFVWIFAIRLKQYLKPKHLHKLCTILVCIIFWEFGHLSLFFLRNLTSQILACIYQGICEDLSQLRSESFTESFSALSALSSRLLTYISPAPQWGRDGFLYRIFGADDSRGGHDAQRASPGHVTSDIRALPVTWRRHD
jgi:hypothetical protein